jgi:uncharacterized protein
MDNQNNALNWFEIPVLDMDRAKSFYETLVGGSMEVMDIGRVIMAPFPTDMASGKVGGALTHSDMHKPSMEGTLVYLNGNPDLSHMLDKVEQNGGKVIIPKTSLGPNGYMAIFGDTEGNAVGLHSTN